MIRTVLFDLMGTLLVEAPDSDADPADNFYRVLCGEGLTLGQEEFWTVLRETPPVATCGSATPFDDRLARVCAKAGLSISLTRAAQLADAICSYSNRVTVSDREAVATLRHVRSYGPVGLVTNYDHPPNIHHLLEREGLRELFDVVIISGEIGVWKPDPSILHAALDQLEMGTEAAVYVGDSDVDIQAADAAGMRSILIRRQGGPSDPLRDPRPEVDEVRPTAVIQSLGELPQALARLHLPMD
ncbi:HAD family hydrolase [Candidatus Latescibacterota bacterium]